MYILPKISRKVQLEISQKVPKQKRKRILFGIQAFSLRSFISINANSRATATKRKTGEARGYRTLRDRKINRILEKIILSFVPRLEMLRLSLDITHIGPFQVLFLAYTTGKGRGIPIAAKVFPKRIRPNSMIATTVKFLNRALPRPRESIILTMDRWFCSPQLLSWLEENNIGYICRIRSDIRVVAWAAQKIPVSEISRDEYSVIHSDTKRRFVRSSWDSKMKEDEPWYLLTNVYDLTRQQVINHYARRFEIEEYFKDAKWIQRLEWSSIRTSCVLETVLLFYILGWWLLTSCCENLVLESRSRRLHVKHKLSFFRYVWERYCQEIWPAQLTFVPP